MEEKLSYSETARRFEVSNHHRIQEWERIYLTEGSEGFAIEQRGRGSKGHPRQLVKEVEEDLLAEVQRHSAPATINDCLRKIAPCGAAQSLAVSGFPPFRPAGRSGI